MSDENQAGEVERGYAVGPYLVLAALAYANDYDGKYPEGKSSTEIFQKLLDGNYISEPAILYVPLPGKVKGVVGQPLKPENVCWDFTVHTDLSGLDASDSDALPVLFLTGYKMAYTSQSRTVPLIKPYPPYGYNEPAWFGLWSEERLQTPGLVVGYKNCGSKFIMLHPDGSVPVLSEDFDSQGKTYRQLTPDGPLP